MKSKIFLLMLGTIILFSCYYPVIAPGPNLHLFTINQALADPSVNDTLIANIIETNYDACLAGIEYADVGIFYYYLDFKEYAGLHNYNVVDEMLRVARNDRDISFAYCYKLHLAGDAVSHNFYVPAVIKKTKLPNYIIHAPAELLLEGRYLDPRANRMMERHAEFDWLVEKATGKDWSTDADKLNTILGGGEFYSKAYKPDTTSWWGKAQNQVYKYAIYFVPANTEVDLKSLMIEEEKAVLRGETGSLSPSGEIALRNADASTALFLYLGTFIIIIIIFYLGFRWNIIGFSKNKLKIR